MSERPIAIVDTTVEALPNLTDEQRSVLREAVKDDPREIESFVVIDVLGDWVRYERRVVETHTGAINLTTGEHRIDQ